MRRPVSKAVDHSPKFLRGVFIFFNSFVVIVILNI